MIESANGFFIVLFSQRERAVVSKFEFYPSQDRARDDDDDDDDEVVVNE